MLIFIFHISVESNCMFLVALFLLFAITGLTVFFLLSCLLGLQFYSGGYGHFTQYWSSHSFHSLLYLSLYRCDLLRLIDNYGILLLTETDILPIRLEPAAQVMDTAEPFYCCYWSFHLC